MAKKGKLIHGMGVNDVDYVVQKMVEYPKVQGKRIQKLEWICPYYQKWKDMLKRCNEVYWKKYPTYFGCTVCVDWLHLSNFIKWVDSQPNRDWQSCTLDKDLLIKGNKTYSPDTCVFVDEIINCFIVSTDKTNTGVSCLNRKNTDLKNYGAWCRDPFKNKSEYLGSFYTEAEAHMAWLVKKRQHAILLAEEQKDIRVRDALLRRFNIGIDEDDRTI